MATLELHFNRQVYSMWSWTANPSHQTAHVIRHIRGRVYLAQIGPRGCETTGETVVLKIARDIAVRELERESRFYENDLRHLQGTVVPEYYGFYKGKAEGLELACMVLEYCSGPGGVDMSDFSRHVMASAYKLHEAGVVHGDFLDGRHFVRMGYGIRIVDFSRAAQHRCESTSYPCRELDDLERSFGGIMNPYAHSVAPSIIAASQRSYW